ncbi:YD repeat protein [Pseudomonas putida S16]|nr:YD repeat protein [Pseudomonas putida S16]
MLWLRNENNSEASFKYDPAGRLIMETGFDKQVTDYLYDQSSNQPTRRIDGDRITRFEYDAMGRLVKSHAGQRGGKEWESETFAYDGNGNLLLAENKACKLQWFYDLAGNNTREHQHFKYMKEAKAGPVWNQNARRQRDEELGCGYTWYVWEGDTLAFECRDREGKGHTTHYVFEPGTFVPVAQAVSNHVVELLRQPVYVFPYDIDKDPVWLHKPMPKAFDAMAWYQCDQLGTPMELTGEDGEIAWSGRYKAWGLAEEQRSDGAKWAEIRNPLRFQGQYWDVETGLHYNRHRYYDPFIGRFISKDPIGFEGSFNSYKYCPAPTHWVDPLGLTQKYIPAPSSLPGFPSAVRAKPKTTVQGGGGLRKRWRLPDGCICEWDSQHGEIEKYDRRGRHLGAFDPETGIQIPSKNPKSTRRIEP